MKIIEVITKQDKKEFIDFPKKLYKDDPYWVCQLDSGIESFLILRKTMLLNMEKQSDGFLRMIMEIQLAELLHLLMR